MKRITISIDDDLHAMAKAHAVSKEMSLSRAISDLLRRLAAGSGRIDPLTRISSRTGLRVSRGEHPVNTEDVSRALDDEDAHSSTQVRVDGERS
jgi:hypothetical protein